MERTEVRGKLSMRDKALSRTDVIARAKAMGLRDYRDRVVLAIQNDELLPELDRMFSRATVDHWIEAELAVDEYDVNHKSIQDQGVVNVHDLHPEIEIAFNQLDSSTRGEVEESAVKMYLVPALIALVSIMVLMILLFKSIHHLV